MVTVVLCSLCSLCCGHCGHYGYYGHCCHCAHYAHCGRRCHLWYLCSLKSLWSLWLHTVTTLISGTSSWIAGIFHQNWACTYSITWAGFITHTTHTLTLRPIHVDREQSNVSFWQSPGGVSHTQNTFPIPLATPPHLHHLPPPACLVLSIASHGICRSLWNVENVPFISKTLCLSVLQFFEIIYFAVSVFPCSNNPCRHGGTCRENLDVSAGYSCECAQNYFGLLCEFRGPKSIVYSIRLFVCYEMSTSNKKFQVLWNS